MVCLWDIDTGKLLQMLIDGISIGDYYLVYAAIFSTDGEKVYVATSNGIQCWHKNPSAGMQNTID